eukprot:TRINITY_DN8689_c0_g1_i3.p1 TRINITY_DN8689_c0_g1~~TRINITY_DN8689_c0_g1_i3.p1  ORF type:complete len:162 (+),score=22.87 TRINITY_DN8689_c0_g1_i3:147-632(+)
MADGIRVNSDIHSPPGVPLNFQVDRTRPITSTSVWLKWQAPRSGSSCTGYEIEISDDSRLKTTLPVDTDKKNPILEIKDLDSLKFYRFKVRAVVDQTVNGQKNRLAAGAWCEPLEVSTEYCYDKSDGFSTFQPNFQRRTTVPENYDLEESRCAQCKACSIQ